MAGATAYAKYDLGFRTEVEKNIPYADQALDVIIGPKEPTIVPPASPVKVPATKKVEQESLLKRKLEREKKEKGESEVKPGTEASKQAPLISIPKPEAPSSSSSITSSIVSNVTTSNLLPGEGSKGSGDTKSTTSSTKTEDTSGLHPSSSLLEHRSIPKDDAKKSESTGKDPKEELREQLKIQLSAYNDYLKEQLQLQENELSRIHSIAMEERVLDEKMRYQRELASSIERLREVERILQGNSSS